MDSKTRIKVLLRDSYSCQNKNCRYSEKKGDKESNLEVHHIIEREKFKQDLKLANRLGFDSDSDENTITLCTTCHRRYHGGYAALCIRGKEYEVETPRRTDYKRFLKEMKQIRREHRDLWGRKLTYKEIYDLMYWLFVMSFEEQDER